MNSERTDTSQIEVRSVRPSDLDSLSQFLNGIFREDTDPEEPIPERLFPLLFAESNLENLEVLEHEGEIVSHVGSYIRDGYLQGYPLKYGLIGEVCTHPDYRDRGFATRLLDNTEEKLISKGVDLILVSGTLNLYRRRNYVDYGSGNLFQLEKPTSSPPKYGNLELVPYKEDELTKVHQLYHNEPVRFERPLQDLAKLLEASSYFHRTGQHQFPLLVNRYGETVAYLVIRVPNEAYDDGGQGPLRAEVAEYGGSRWALTRCLPQVFDRLEEINPSITQVKWYVPHQDLSLTSFLENTSRSQGLGINTDSHDAPYPDHTAKFLSPVILQSFFNSYLQFMVGSEATSSLTLTTGPGREKFYLQDEYGDWELELTSSRALQKLIFTGLGKSSLNRERLPQESAELLRTIFPIPTLNPGLNYI